MKQAEITIAGKQYPVTFDLQSMMNFEEITGQPFLGAPLDTLKNRVALIAACAIRADKDTPLTVEDVTGKMDREAMMQIITASATVIGLVNDFFKTPDIEKQNPDVVAEEQAAAEAPQSEEDSPKN